MLALICMPERGLHIPQTRKANQTTFFAIRGQFLVVIQCLGGSDDSSSWG